MLSNADAAIELECMAIQWAIKKCEFYLQGLHHFEVLTDHRPLVGIFKKQLNLLDNARLMRMREKLTGFNFEVKWVAGKSHSIADALSRAPIFQPQEEEFTVDCSVSCLRITNEQMMSWLHEGKGEEYEALLKAIEEGKDISKLPTNNPARKYKDIRDRISINTEDGGKLSLIHI